MLAELLERWDAGLTANPTERRMALRLSQQRAARVAAGPPPAPEDGVAGLATVRALFGDDAPPAPQAPPDGDDDDPEELDGAPDGEVTHFYDDAFGIIP